VGLDDIRISRVGDGEAANSEVFTASGSELNVGAVVVVDTGLGQHGVVLDLGSSEVGRVVGEDDEFCLAASKLLDSLLVAKVVLSRLDDKSESAVDRRSVLLRLLGHF